ncbi:MAG TPA: condensation domain-containing protein, partial [Ktedonobacteraceae bacterium]|nr:condensation domain-containing protein [Ktedonobacteraceae bacterium]
MNDFSKAVTTLSPEQLELLLRKLDQLQPPAATTFAIQPKARNANDELPLSFTQEGMWFSDQLGAGTSSLTISSAVRLFGSLHYEALEKSLNALISRHESLRTTFVSTEGRPAQRITEHLTIPIQLHDVRQKPEEQREALVQQLMVSGAQQPFDLARGPLIRADLYQLQTQEHIFTLTLHHILADGWSFHVLVRELVTLYIAYQQGLPSPLPPLSLQYADYAGWQRDRLQGELFAAHLTYWQQQLAGAPALLTLPTDRPRPAQQSHRGAKVSILLPAETSQALKQSAQREGLTPFMLLLTSWAVLLGRLSGQEDVVIGSPIAGRPYSELEALIGVFVNTLLFRVDLSGEPTVRQLFERVRQVTLGAYEHQEFPFEKLVEQIAPARDGSHQALFQTMLILQNIPSQPLNGAGLIWQPVQVDNQTAKYDLEMSLTETEAGHFAGYLEYNTDLFAARTVQHWLTLWQRLLNGMLADLAQPVSHLPLLSPEEEQALLEQGQPFSSLPEALQQALLDQQPEAENMRFLVLDSHGQCCPPGVVGELYLENSAHRRRRTGALARYRADGQPVYVGQVEEQVALHGFSLNLYEIARVIETLPTIAHCALCLRTSEAGSPLLVAYLQAAKSQQPVPTTHLRTALKDLLPNYQLPAQVVWLDHIPQTREGHPDRDALLALPLETIPSTAPTERPSTMIEETLVAIWQEVLQVEQVGLTENFFELGGHSLLATQVVAR